MITITRSLARQFRAVLRRAGIKSAAGQKPLLHIVASAEGLRLQAAIQRVAVERYVPGKLDAEEIVLSIDALADFEGRGDDPVELENADSQRITAKWSDRGIPQLTSYDSPPPAKRDSHGFPKTPETLSANQPELWQALRDACQTAATDATRYALNCLQLRGDRGQVVATDGSQILRQNGFAFPFENTPLILANRALGCPELEGQASFSVGGAEEWVSFVAGDWQLHLRIEKDARFPRVDDIVGSASAARAQLTLSEGDAEYLIECLPRLPGNDDQYRSVTLDLSQYADIRARGEGQEHPTQVLLSNSQTSGDPLAICTNRTFLLHALRLGFREFNLFSAKSPVLCDDGRRQYLWALLDPADVVKCGQTMTCLQSPLQKPRIVRMKRRKPVAQPTTEPSTVEETELSNVEMESSTISPPLNNPPQFPGASVESDVPGTPLAQAIALRAALREALALNARLIADIKKQKKQSRLVDSTLAALEQLRSAG